MNITALTRAVIAASVFVAASPASSQSVTPSTSVLAPAVSAIGDSISSAISNAVAAEVDNVGFVYVGPVGDHGWTYRHDIGRQAVEKELGINTTFVESVSEGADAERVIRKAGRQRQRCHFYHFVRLYESDGKSRQKISRHKI